MLTFPLEMLKQPNFQRIRNEVIANYTLQFYDNQTLQEQTLYNVLVAAESSLRLLKEPQPEGTKIDPIAALNMMLGIREDLHHSDEIFCNFYFFFCNIIILYIIISLCHILDEKHSESFDANWTMAPCPPRDILLEFRKQLEEAEQEGREVQFKVCSLDKPLPPEPLRNAFLWPVRYPRPALNCLIVVIVFSMFLSALLLPIDNDGFFKAFTMVLDYCNMIRPFPLNGTIWMFLLWALTFIDLIVFNYTIYSLSLLFLDVVFWIAGVEEEFTPVFLE
ncbi:hypothetical protein GCK32_000939 [Trichostrongylus colubriformis]|uniref:Uncharacterized protein n=1 Tax=Trichostrongylus colubriformis TaxID=6319 RepID=A0AAN8FT38_TRICO